MPWMSGIEAIRRPLTRRRDAGRGPHRQRFDDDRLGFASRRAWTTPPGQALGLEGLAAAVALWTGPGRLERQRGKLAS